MKARVVIASLLSVVILIALLGIGIARGQGLGERVYEAYFTDSIDAYLGTEISVEPDSCKSIEEAIKQRLTNSDAPRNLENLLEEINSTLNNGKVTRSSYDWFKIEKLTSAIGFPADSNSLPVQIRKSLDFDPGQIKADAVADFSDRDIEKRVNELRSKGQLPSRVTTEYWYEPFRAKYFAACSPTLDPMIKTAVGSFDANVSDLSSKIRLILRGDWVSDGYEKIGHLVAYNPDNPSNCSGSSGCAIFWVETATPCELKVTVEFSNSANEVEDVVSATKFVGQASTRTSMQVSSYFADGTGFYNITEAKCK
jgi:hypothetical protein